VRIFKVQSDRNGSSVENAVKRPPEDYGKEDQTTVAAFLPWRGSLVPSP
jgi:hypothetical protein